MAYKDPTKQREFQRIWQAKQRAKYKSIVIEMFGGSCMECGFDNVRALHLDHITAIKRVSYSTRGADSGSGLWRKVATGKIPKELVQLLCANCHAVKTYNELYN